MNLCASYDARCFVARPATEEDRAEEFVKIQAFYSTLAARRKWLPASRARAFARLFQRGLPPRGFHPRSTTRFSCGRQRDLAGEKQQLCLTDRFDRAPAAGAG